MISNLFVRGLGFIRWLNVSVLLLLSIAVSWAAADAQQSTDDGRTPLAEIHGETIYVEDVKGAVALRIYKHELDIYSLLKSEAERRIEDRLLTQEAKRRGISTESLLASIEEEGSELEGAKSETAINEYLAEHPPNPDTDRDQARARVRLYLSERARLEKRVAFMASLREQAGTKILLAPPSVPRTEVDIAGAPIRGPQSASVEIVHFASFGSRNSARSARKLERLREAYPTQIRQIHRNLLNDRDEVGLLAARLGFAARESGSDTELFWAYHDAIFANERPPSAEQIETLARELGLSKEVVQSAKTNPERLQAVKTDIDSALAAGAPREPSLFINGRFISGLVPYDEIDRIVANEIEAARNSKP